MIAENRYFKIVYRRRGDLCSTSTTEETVYYPELVAVPTTYFSISNNAPYPEPEPPPRPPLRYYIHDWEPHLKKYRRRWQSRAAAPRRFPVTRWTNPGVRDAQRNIRKEQLRRLRS